jgi:hypothetical protein
VRAQLLHELLIVDERNARRDEHARLFLAAQHPPQAVPRRVRRRRQGAEFRDPADLALGDRHLLDLVGLEQLEELRHRDLDRARREEPAL